MFVSGISWIVLISRFANDPTRNITKEGREADQIEMENEHQLVCKIAASSDLIRKSKKSSPDWRHSSTEPGAVATG